MYSAEETKNPAVPQAVVYQDKLPGITLIKLPELFPITTSN